MKFHQMLPKIDDSGNAKSKDLLAVQIAIEGLAKRMDGLEDKLVESETKVMQIDSKTQKMARQARLVFVDQIASRSTLTSHAQKNIGKQQLHKTQ